MVLIMLAMILQFVSPPGTLGSTQMNSNGNPFAQMRLVWTR